VFLTESLFKELKNCHFECRHAVSAIDSALFQCLNTILKEAFHNAGEISGLERGSE
jgi:hypothetical protein